MGTTTKYIALYGGSFNPSTQAHRDIGLYLLNELKVDEVWYLVSPQNPFKSRDDMASFADRVAMAKLNVEDHPKLQVKDIEAAYAATKPDGIIESAETLSHILKEFPIYRFIWILGTDNFASLHTWGNAQYITTNFPIAVVARDGSTPIALQSPSAHFAPRLDDPAELRVTNGWYFSHMPTISTSATIGRDDLKEGRTPTGLRPRVVRYALSHGIYGAHPTSSDKVKL